MPIHITRREFVAGSFVAGAGILGIQESWASMDDRDPDRWALLSDTHIPSTRDTKREDVSMSDHLIRVSKEVVDLKRMPSGVFINGDCAYLSGLPEDYALLNELLRPFKDAKLPLHMTLGNHDSRETFWASVKGATEKSRPLQSKHVSVIEAKRANWFLVDSLDKTNVTPGLLGDEQLKWLAKALDTHPKKPAIVMGHHQPAYLTGGIGGLTDSKEFLDVILPRKHVKAYIFGHTHHWNVTDKEGLHLINLPPVAYVFQKTDPSGWVDVQLNDAGMSIELRSLDSTHKANGERHDLKWRT